MQSWKIPNSTGVRIKINIDHLTVALLGPLALPTAGKKRREP